MLESERNEKFVGKKSQQILGKLPFCRPITATRQCDLTLRLSRSSVASSPPLRHLVETQRLRARSLGCVQQAACNQEDEATARPRETKLGRKAVCHVVLLFLSLFLKAKLGVKSRRDVEQIAHVVRRYLHPGKRYVQPPPSWQQRCSFSVEKVKR